MTSKFYVGRNAGTREVFKSDIVPTHESHGGRYAAVIGPFRTLRAANFMAIYGEGSPHTYCVSATEKIAAKYKDLPSLRIRPLNRTCGIYSCDNPDHKINVNDR